MISRQPKNQYSVQNREGKEYENADIVTRQFALFGAISPILQLTRVLSKIWSCCIWVCLLNIMPNFKNNKKINIWLGYSEMASFCNLSVCNTTIVAHQLTYPLSTRHVCFSPSLTMVNTPADSYWTNMFSFISSRKCCFSATNHVNTHGEVRRCLLDHPEQSN